MAEASPDRTGTPEEQRPEPAVREAEQLCRFLAQTAQLDLHAQPGAQLAELTQEIFQLETVAVFDVDLREVYVAGAPVEAAREMLESTCLFETCSEDRETGFIRRVLRLGTLPIGALLLRGELSALTADALASMTAVTFDRYHAFANESRTEAARRTEQMRTMVLDSLAHAYKTPLTAIAAASSGLVAISKLSRAQAELLDIITTETKQLSDLTTKLLRTARLEVHELQPRMERVVLAPLLDDVVASLREPLSGFTVSIALSRDDLALVCDRSLLIAMLTQYLENAAKYGEQGTAIEVRAMSRARGAVFSVRNLGPPIPPADCERVFDRYFRSTVHSTMAPGTGIGLAIVKRAALAHGGDVWVTSDAARGTTFFIHLPNHEQGDEQA